MNEIESYMVLLYTRGSEFSKVDKTRKVGFYTVWQANREMAPYASSSDRASKESSVWRWTCVGRVLGSVTKPSKSKRMGLAKELAMKPFWTKLNGWIPWNLQAVVVKSTVLADGYVLKLTSSALLCMFVVVTASKVCHSNNLRPMFVDL